MRVIPEKKILVVNKDKLFTDDRHVLFLGSSGTGKTVFVSTLALSRWNAGYKVVAFSLKGEMLTIGFPESDKTMVQRLAEFDKTPTAYPHEVLVPFTKSKFDSGSSKKMKTTLPRHTAEFIEFQRQMKAEGRLYGWSQFKPFKISFKQLRVTDLTTMLSTATPTGIATLELLFRTQNFKSLGDVIGSLIRLSSKDKSVGEKLVVSSTGGSGESEIGATNTYLGLLRLLANLQESGFICEESSAYKLDLDAIMRDKETITTFDLSNCEPSLGFLVFVSIMRQCLELRNKKAYPKMVLVIPELPNYAPSDSRISPYAIGAGSTVSALTILQTLSRESRLLGVTLLADAQRPQDIDSSVRSNFGWLSVSATQPKNVDWIAESLFPVPATVAQNLPTLKIGYFYVQDLSSKLYAYPLVVAPTPCHHRRAGEDIWSWIYRQPFVKRIQYEDDTTETLGVQIKRPVKASTKAQPKMLDLLKARLVEIKASGVESITLEEVKTVAGLGKDVNLQRLIADFHGLGKVLGYKLTKKRIDNGKNSPVSWVFQFTANKGVA